MDRLARANQQTEEVMEQKIHARGVLGPSSAPHLRGPCVLELEDNRQIARMTGFGSDEQDAMAAYIAASWNACVDAGISREALESGVVAEMVEAIQIALGRIERHPTPYSRDEKRKALEAVLAKLGIKK